MTVTLGCGSDVAAIRETEFEAQKAKLKSLETAMESLRMEVENLKTTKPAAGVIEAEGFAVVDNTGRRHAFLGRAALGKQAAVPGVYLYDVNQTKRAALLYTGYGSGLAIYDHFGRDIMLFGKSRHTMFSGPTEIGEFKFVSKPERECDEIKYFGERPPGN